MNLVRGIAGVLAGYGIVVLILRLFSVNYVLPGIVTGALAGGFVTAWIAGGRELPFASALGMVLIAMSFIAMRRAGASQPGLYEMSVAGCGPVAALVGAAVRMLLRRR